jgi:hypothetical protein
MTNSDLGGYAFGPVVITESDHAGLTKVGFQRLAANQVVVLVGEPQVVKRR